jgi:hypothetical protein
LLDNTKRIPFLTAKDIAAGQKLMPFLEPGI